METTFGEVRLSGAAKGLLAKLKVRGGDLDMAEFLSECAYWALRDGFDEIRSYQYPSEPRTTAYVEYAQFPREKRLRLDAKFFTDNPEINGYGTQRLFIYHKNKSLLEWLQDLKKYIPAEDVVSQQKIDNRISQFRVEDDPLIEKAKDIFNVEL